MRGQPNGHTVAFRARHLMSGEVILGYLEGWIVSRTSNRVEDYKSGQLILTNRRVCLYRKALLGEHISEIGLAEVVSIESIERSGFRFVRVGSDATKLIFRSSEEDTIWCLVIDRLRKIRADPSWGPPQPRPDTNPATQSVLPTPPAASHAAMGRGSASKLIDRLARQHELDELFVSPVDQSAIGLNFRVRQLVLVTNARELAYRFDQIISVEAAANDVTLSQTNRGSQLVGAAIGGLLLGGTGLLLGGLTGSSRAVSRVKGMTLKLVLDDMATPHYTISFFLARDKKGLPTNNPLVKAAEVNLERIHAQVVRAMREARPADPSMAPLGVEELERLWGLRQGGALTEAEFEDQKRRLLNQGTTVAEGAPVVPDQFALHVVDWGKNKVRVIAAMQKKDPSLGLLAAAKIYGSQGYCFARGLPLAEATRIKAQLFAVGVVLEMTADQSGSSCS